MHVRFIDTPPEINLLSPRKLRPYTNGHVCRASRINTTSSVRLLQCLNAEVSADVSSASRAQHMRAGSFFAAIQGKREQCGAIFTDLRHAAPRKLPMHSHELAFFALLLDGLYAEG